MDMIIMGVYPNDIHDDVSYKTFRHSYKDIEMMFTDVRYKNGLQEYIDSLPLLNYKNTIIWIYKYIYIAKPVINFVFSKFKNTNVIKGWQYSSINTNVIGITYKNPSSHLSAQERIDRCVANTVEIYEVLKEKGIDFGIIWIYNPCDAYWVYEPYLAYQEEIFRLGPYTFSIDMKQDIEEIINQVGWSWHFPDDHHFNELGNKLFADHVFQQLRKTEPIKQILN